MIIFISTPLNKQLFNKFILYIYKLNKEEIKDKNIRIMQTIYSYYKKFLDYFLDYIYDDMEYYLLKLFKNSIEIQFYLCLPIYGR